MAIPKLESNLKEDDKAEEGEISEEPDWEIRQVGTIFEVDPVLGADGYTMDLSMMLEHHTAAPETEPLHINSPPLFHSKRLTTQLALISGSYTLLGSWKPTGKPEYEDNDLMHLIFVTANVLTSSRVIEVEDIAAEGEK